MNPYLRAAAVRPELVEEAAAKLEARLAGLDPIEVVDVQVIERARNADGTYRADDPATPDIDEAWVEAP